jgi:ATP-dependent Lon protease
MPDIDSILENDDVNAEIDRKLREHFDGKIVRKDLTKSIMF